MSEKCEKCGQDTPEEILVIPGYRWDRFQQKWIKVDLGELNERENC